MSAYTNQSGNFSLKGSNFKYSEYRWFRETMPVKATMLVARAFSLSRSFLLPRSHGYFLYVMCVKPNHTCIIYLILYNAHMRVSYSPPIFAIEFTKVTQFAWAGMLGATTDQWSPSAYKPKTELPHTQIVIMLIFSLCY